MVADEDAFDGIYERALFEGLGAETFEVTQDELRIIRLNAQANRNGEYLTASDGSQTFMGKKLVLKVCT